MVFANNWSSNVTTTVAMHLQDPNQANLLSAENRIVSNVAIVFAVQFSGTVDGMRRTYTHAPAFEWQSNAHKSTTSICYALVVFHSFSCTTKIASTQIVSRTISEYLFFFGRPLSQSALESEQKTGKSACIRLFHKFKRIEQKTDIFLLCSPKQALCVPKYKAVRV